MSEEEVPNQNQISTQVQTQEEEKPMFKKLIHLRFITPGIQETFRPSYILYKIGSSRYFIAVSKGGRVIVYGRLAFMVTSNYNIAVDVLPETFWEPGGPISEFVELDDVQTDYGDDYSGNARITYIRNGERKTIVVPKALDEMLENILEISSAIIYDALIYFTHY